MPFPLNPTNEQQATVNGVVYTYNSASGVWSVLTTTGANISGNNISATNSISSVVGSFSGNVSTGNISGTTTTFTNVSGTLTTASQPNITSVGTLTALNVNGNVAAYHINPVTNNTYDLGTSAARWRNIYTQDLHLNNGIGDWTIVEGEDDLFLYNNKRNKVYKFNLIEIDPAAATPKINELNKKS